MKRRNFLKGLIGFAGISAAPSILGKTKDTYSPTSTTSIREQEQGGNLGATQYVPWYTYCSKVKLNKEWMKRIENAALYGTSHPEVIQLEHVDPYDFFADVKYGDPVTGKYDLKYEQEQKWFEDNNYFNGKPSINSEGNYLAIMHPDKEKNFRAVKSWGNWIKNYIK